MLPATFPQRPRLRPFFYVVPLDDGRVQLRSAYRSLIISGAGAPELTRLMLPLLDGTRTTDEIVRVCDGHAPDAVRHALALLQEKAVLEDGVDDDRSPLSPDLQETFADQVRLFSSFVGNPHRVQSDLQAKRVALVGASPLGLAIGRQLAQCGLGALHVVATSAVQAGAALALVEEPNRNGSSHCRFHLDPYADDAIDERVAAAAAGADLVIAPSDGPAPASNRRVNDICVSARVPWLPVVLYGSDVALGPLVVPGQTACFVCYELRMKGNLIFADEYVAFETHLLNGPSQVAQGALKAYVPIVAGLAAVEAIKFLTKFTYPIALGRLIRFNLVNYQFMVHPVLRLPRCPRCGAIAPTVHEWEL
jgi:bacteriocin biosynthesis cyclodehydratase domain-containing protein